MGEEINIIRHFGAFLLNFFCRIIQKLCTRWTLRVNSTHPKNEDIFINWLIDKD